MKKLGIIGTGKKIHSMIELKCDRGIVIYSECGASGVFKQKFNQITIIENYDESKVTCSRCLKILSLNKKECP